MKILTLMFVCGMLGYSRSGLDRLKHNFVFLFTFEVWLLEPGVSLKTTLCNNVYREMDDHGLS